MLDKITATEILERNESDEGQEVENFDVSAVGRRGLLHRFAPQRLASRIVLLNLLGLVILVTGILYFNQFRQGLIDARVQSLTTQAQIIAAAVAGSATADTGSIVINPDSLEDNIRSIRARCRPARQPGFSDQSRNNRPRAAPAACQFNHPWTDYRPRGQSRR